VPALQSLKLQRVLQSQTLRFYKEGQGLSKKKEAKTKEKAKGGSPLNSISLFNPGQA